MRPKRTNKWVVLAVGLVVLAVYLAHVAVYWPQINDDAFITFRYSKFLTLGRGPYFNIGEHVEGYTNFLMMLLMAGALALFGDDDVLFVAKLIGASGGLVAILAGWALCARWLRRIETFAPYAELLAWAGAALAATNCAYAFNSTSGLETTLFSAWIVLGLWLLQKGRDEQRYRGAGIAFALAALTRPEGAFIFAAVYLGRLIAAEWRTSAGRRALLWDGLIVAASVGAQLVVRYWLYDGELLPNTYYAKRGGIAWRMSTFEYIGNFAVGTMGGVLPVLALFPYLARNRAVSRYTLPTLAAVWASVATVFLTGADWMPGYRLLVPYAPAWSALALCGVAGAVDRLRTRAAPLAAAAVAVLLIVGLFWWQGPERGGYYRYSVVRAAGYISGHAVLADWLSQQLQPGATVALMDIGIVGFKCVDLNILDITGLTDRYIARSPGGFLMKEFDPAYVFDRRPEFIIIAAQGPAGPTDARAVFELKPWTTIEERLLSAPAFRRHYLGPRVVAADTPELERLAAVCGAERVFRHYHPDCSYFLFAYHYHGAASVSPAQNGEREP